MKIPTLKFTPLYKICVKNKVVCKFAESVKIQP